jgi:hypothetical protein
MLSYVVEFKVFISRRLYSKMIIKKTKLGFFSIFMVLCMLASSLVFTSSCQSGETVENLVANRRPLTITLLTIVEDSTTPEAIAEVERELNLISEARFTTRIRLIALTAGEYEAEIARRFDVYDAEQERIREETSIQASLDRASRDRARQERAAGITAAPTRRPTEPPRTTELYTERIQWPDITANQMDIFLITSSGMFHDLMRDSRLEAMDDELNTKAKVLREYLHPSVMMAGQFNERTFAIPTNKAIGEATYIAINRNLTEEYNLAAAAANAAAAAAAAADPEAEPAATLRLIDFNRISEYQHLTDYLEWVRTNRPGVALIEGPFVPIKNYEPLFPTMPYFPAVSNLGAVGAARPLVFTPEQEPTEAPTRAPTEPPTDEDGQLITEDPAAITTIPPTTLPPRNTPAVLELAPGSISMVNKYTHSAFATIANLNQEFREKGLFEASPVGPDRERAAFILTGTLEDMLTSQANEIQRDADGEPVRDENGRTVPIYEYILYSHPIASRADMQSAMYGISVSSRVPVMRTMEIITLLNTNKRFKNAFQFGVQGTHYFYNEAGRIERINDDWMINMDYTGNHFIADLMDGEHSNKWGLAKQHNLNVVNSVFINFYFDAERFTPDVEESIPAINALGERFWHTLVSGNIPAGFEDIDEYIADYIEPAFADAGWAELNTEIRAQTNPPTD